MDESLRDIYNRFGPSALDFDPRKDEIKLVSDIAMQYIMWGVLAFIFTLPVAARASRTWIAILAIGMFSVEVCLCITETSMPGWMIPSTLTEHELVFYLHAAFPALVAQLAALAMALYVDIDQTSIAVLKDVFEHQKVAHSRSVLSSSTHCMSGQSLRELLQQVETVVDIARKPVPSATDIDAVERVRSRLCELSEEMEVVGDGFTRRIEDLRMASANPGSSYYWIIFVLLYGGIYFMQ